MATATTPARTECPRPDAAPAPAAGQRPSRSGVDAVIAQDVVERRLVVPVTCGQSLQHENALHAVLAPGKGPGARAADADRPRRNLAAGQFGARLDIDDVGGRREDRPRADHGDGIGRLEYSPDARAA